MRAYQLFYILLVMCLGQAVANVPAPQQPSAHIIPRKILFSGFDRTQVQISPDGKWIAYVEPYRGHKHIWLRAADGVSTAMPITQNISGSIHDFHWSYQAQSLLVISEDAKQEMSYVYHVNTRSGVAKKLLGLKRAKIDIRFTSPAHPHDFVIDIKTKRSDFHDIYRISTQTGDLRLLYKNDVFQRCIFDSDLNIKVGVSLTPDGGYALYRFQNNRPQEELLKVSVEDIFTTYPLELDKSGENLYLVDSQGLSYSQLISYNLQTKTRHLIAAYQNHDIDKVLFHPLERSVQAYASERDRKKWHAVDPDIQSHIQVLEASRHGNFEIVSSDLHDTRWIVAFQGDTHAVHYYLYHKTKQKLVFLFSENAALDAHRLAPMETIEIAARDKLSLVCYLTLPLDAAKPDGIHTHEPLPLVILVHEGPYSRERWGFHILHQWLANRGYAVLSVNYRGSTGFGKDFIRAGYGEWGGKMELDLLDACDWAIKEGIADPKRIAIMGNSYGGYAALMGMALYPHYFACGIDIVGLTNLEAFLNKAYTYWEPGYALLKQVVGADVESESGRLFLSTHSPITYVNRLEKPLLVVHGGKDLRGRQEENERIIDHLRSKGVPNAYLVYPNEGKDIKKLENKLFFYAFCERFLAKHLGGHCEPVQEEFVNTEVQIKSGREYLGHALLNSVMYTIQLHAFVGE